MASAIQTMRSATGSLKGAAGVAVPARRSAASPGCGLLPRGGVVRLSRGARAVRGSPGTGQTRHCLYKKAPPFFSIPCEYPFFTFSFPRRWSFRDVATPLLPLQRPGLGDPDRRQEGATSEQVGVRMIPSQIILYVRCCRRGIRTPAPCERALASPPPRVSPF